MNKIVTHVKRLLTAILATAMVFTSMPAQVAYAAIPEGALPVNLKDDHAVYSDLENVGLDEDDGYYIIDPTQPITFTVTVEEGYRDSGKTYLGGTLSGNNPYTLTPEGDRFSGEVRFGIVANPELKISYAEGSEDLISFSGGAYCIYTSENTYYWSSERNALNFYATVVPYYTPVVKVDDDVYTSVGDPEPTETGMKYKYTIDIEDYEPHAIELSAVPITKEVEVTDCLGNAGTFTPGPTMTLKSEATEDAPAVYTVYQKDGYSFEVTTEEHYIANVSSSNESTTKDGDVWTVAAGDVGEDGDTIEIRINEEDKYCLDFDGDEAAIEYTTGDPNSASTEWSEYDPDDFPSFYKNDTVYYRITPPEGYVVESVCIDDVIQSAVEGKQYYSVKITDEPVTVTIATMEAAVITVSTASENLRGFNYCEVTGESRSLEKYAGFVNGAAKITVDKGSRVEIYSFNGSSMNAAMCSVYKVTYKTDADSQEKEAVRNDETSRHTAGPFNGTTGSIVVTELMLEEDKVVFDTAQEGYSELIFTPGDDCLLTVGGRKYARTSDFKFKIAKKETSTLTKAVIGATYTINGDSTVYTAYKNGTLSSDPYVIPSSDMKKAIRAGGITIRAILGSARQNITFTKPYYVKEIAFAEYTRNCVNGKIKYVKITGTDSFVDLSNDAVISVGTGNVIAFSIEGRDASAETNNKYYATANSVKVDGETLKPVPADEDSVFAGKWTVTADADKTVDVRVYETSPVTLAQASGAVKDIGEAELTKITVTDESDVLGKDVKTSGGSVSKNKAIDFKVELNGNGENRAVLGTPAAYYEIEDESTESGVSKVALELKAGTEDGYWSLPLEEVQKAIEAGGAITIEAAAEPIPYTTVTVKADPDKIAGIYCQDNLGSMSSWLVPKPVDPDKKEITFDVFIGKMPVIQGVDLADEDKMAGATVVKIELGDRVLGYFGADKTKTGLSFSGSENWYCSLGTITGPVTATLTTAVLKKDDILFAGDYPEDPEHPEEGKLYYEATIPEKASPSEDTTKQLVSIDGTSYVAASQYTEGSGIGGISIGGMPIGSKTSGLRVHLDTPYSTTYNYGIKQPVKYSIQGTAKENLQKTDTTSYILPESALRKAAFSDSPVTITAYVESRGYKPQKIYFKGKQGSISYTAVVAGETYNTDPMSIGGEYLEIPYGQTAQVKIAQNTGFKLNKAYLTTYKNAYDKRTELLDGADPSDWTDEMQDEFNTWLAEEAAKADGAVISAEVEDGSAAYTIENIKEEYAVFTDTEEQYVLVVDGAEVTDPYTADVPYSDSISFTIKHGNESVNPGNSEKCWLSAVIPGDPDPGDISQKVFGSSSVEDEILFIPYGVGADAQGKKVTITIREKTEEGVDPAFAFTATLNVGKAPDEDDVKITAETPPTLELGVPATITVGGKNVSADSYEIKITGGDDLYPDDVTNSFEITGSKDGKSFTLMAYARECEYLVGNDKNLKMWLLDPKTGDPIGEGTAFTVSKPDVSGADITGAVTVTPSENSLVFTFDLPESLSEQTDGLYWVVTAIQETVDGSKVDIYDDLIDEIVPVSQKSHEFYLAGDPETFAADPAAYTVSVILAQVTGLSGEGKYDPHKLISGQTSNMNFIESDVYTKVGGLFATSVKFNGNKKLPKKIYSNMDELCLGSVSYNKIGNGKKAKTPTVQKLTRVEIQDAAGNVLDCATAAADWQDGTSLRVSGNSIFFTPSEFQEEIGKRNGTTIYGTRSGKYSVVAYAMEPKGRDVTAKYSLNIKKAIETLLVSDFDDLYRPAKKSVTVQARAYDGTDLIGEDMMLGMKTAKDVTWSLVTADKMHEPFKHAGISINSKKGKLTVSSSTIIPEDGLKFCICATAVDWKGNTARGFGGVIVHGLPREPKYIRVDTLKNTTTELRNGESYYSGEVSGRLEVYDGNDSTVDSIYTVKGAKAVKLLGQIYGLAVQKPVLKSVKLTAKANDGSGKKAQVNFKVKSDKNLKAQVVMEPKDKGAGDGMPGIEAGFITEATCNAGETLAFTNIFASNIPVYIFVNGEHESQIKHKIKVTGAKKSASAYANGTLYKITPTKKTTTITLTDTAAKKNAVIKINNMMVGSGKINVKAAGSRYAVYDTKAKKYTTKTNNGAIYANLYYDDAATGIGEGGDGLDLYKYYGSINKVTYTVTTGKGKKAKPVTGTIRISTTDEALKDVFDYNKSVNDKISAISSFGQYDVVLDEKGSFEIDYVNEYGNLSLGSGKHTFTVTPYNADGKASKQSQTVTVKTLKAPKTKVEMKKTTFNNFGTDQEIGFKTMNGVAISVEAAEGGPVYDPSALFLRETLGANESGTITNFKDAFRAGRNIEDKNMLWCIKDPAPNAAATTGWVQYRWLRLDGFYYTGAAKVTVKGAEAGAAP